MEYNTYNLVNMTYSQNAKIVVDKYCNGFSIINIGASNMVANGVPLAPPVPPALLGEAVSFGGNLGELFDGRIDISFTGAVGRCIVTQKIYVPNIKK